MYDMTGSFSPIARMKLVPLTYWAPGTLGDDNEHTFSNPVTIYGRWEERRSELQGANGEQIVSRTMAIVDRDVEEGGFLAQGVHADTDPHAVDAAKQIQGFGSSPDLRIMEQVRRAYL